MNVNAAEPDLRVDLCGISFPNPVLSASGPLGHGREVAQVYPLAAFGGFVTKSITLEPREGNPRPHWVETDAGWLNSVGLRNPGLAGFLTKELPFLRTLGIPIVASFAGHAVEEYRSLAEWLSDAAGVAALELNASCPNVADGMMFGTDPLRMGELVREVRKTAKLPLIVKLSPNVTDIVAIARAAADEGADALTLINTLQGLSIDVRTRRPRLGAGTGGLSGPAIRPVAVRMVWEVSRRVRVPIIGCGGIATAEHAAEFILAGASLVAVGSAGLSDAGVIPRVVAELRDLLRDQGAASIRDLVGALRTGAPSDAGTA
jgi:dihydroorotate dehydrogenase (NAD+) catalytic subunit